MLEHHANLSASTAQLRIVHRRQVLAVDDHLAGGRAVEQVDIAHERALARAAATDDAKHLTGGNAQVDATQRLYRAVFPRISLGDTP